MKKGDNMKKENTNILEQVKKTVKDNMDDIKHDYVDTKEKKNNYKNLKEKEINKWLEINGERIARELLNEEIKKIKK